MVRHVLRNALMPLATLLGLSLPTLFSGALVVESTVNYPGMGLLFWNTAQGSDFPVLLVVTLVVGIATVLGSPLTAHRSPLTAHRSPLTAHRSPTSCTPSSIPDPERGMSTSAVLPALPGGRAAGRGAARGHQVACHFPLPVPEGAAAQPV
ncbi:ABC transporter permease subunit [Streptomyces sp. NPDC056983]|uniref:ABC transporter permease subunit n=1 Tax=Streptomyces sp. NPDC056983 TaxID=3345987 RepID=UPI003632D995